MPVPYKGGTPWGSFLGSAGGAAATAGDELDQGAARAGAGSIWPSSKVCWRTRMFKGWQ